MEKFSAEDNMKTRFYLRISFILNGLLKKMFSINLELIGILKAFENTSFCYLN